ncbi:hypothetical protein [Hoeflea sp. BAL378]|uniref:hypothetical protein n=1 Tax=Hoeflea sp. BAL378 TaxID=1547437 RepID=UPI000A7D2E13|nr:hypothetical protein [Hoeflea sp. BAL378]
MLSAIADLGSGQAPALAPEREAELIDRLVGMVLALEPIEHKQYGAGDGEAEARGPADRFADAGASAPADAPPAGSEAAAPPTLVAESTRRMLAQMRAVLDREAARLGVDGAEGKAAVDQVSLIARTLEKIDQMERLIAEDQARTTARTLTPDEREEMRRTVRQLILAAAERLAAERRAEPGADAGAGMAEMAERPAET